MGRNNNYLTIRGNILIMKLFPSLNEIYSLTIKKRRNKLFHNIPLNHDTIAMIASQYNPSSESIVTAIPRQNFISCPKEQPYCTYCNRKGHTKDKCLELYGYSPGWVPQKKNFDNTWNDNPPYLAHQVSTSDFSLQFCCFLGVSPTSYQSFSITVQGWFSLKCFSSICTSSAIKSC